MNKPVIDSKGKQAFNVPLTTGGLAFLELCRLYQNRPNCKMKIRGRGKRVSVGAANDFISLDKAEWAAVYVTSSTEQKFLNKLYSEATANYFEIEKLKGIIEQDKREIANLKQALKQTTTQSTQPKQPTQSTQPKAFVKPSNPMPDAFAQRVEIISLLQKILAKL